MKNLKLTHSGKTHHTWKLKAFKVSDLTALDKCAAIMASANGHMNIVKYLVSKGAVLT